MNIKFGDKLKPNKLTPYIVKKAFLDSFLFRIFSYKFEGISLYIYNNHGKTIAEINTKTAEFEKVFVNPGSEDDDNLQKFTNAIKLNNEPNDDVSEIDVKYDPQKGWNFDECIEEDDEMKMCLSNV